jgi:hypothetical protein
MGEEDDYAEGPPPPPRPWWVRDVVYPAVAAGSILTGVLAMYLLIRRAAN